MAEDATTTAADDRAKSEGEPGVRTLLRPTQMIAHLNRFVLGQERAKKDLATAVYNHYLGCMYAETPAARYRDLERQHILLLGPTGCGKTYLLRTLADLLDVPMSVASATSFAETGYVGEHVESLIANLLALTNWDVAAAQRGIVFLDEIDKIKRGKTDFRDVSGEGVQAGLLTLLDGQEVTIRSGNHSAVVDVSKILFVCAGAFATLPAVIRKRIDEMGEFGFHATQKPWREVADADLLEQVETRDLEQFGMIPELIGRFSAISGLRPLTRDELVAIMTSAEGSVVAKQQVLFGLHGIDLRFEREALEAIADEACRLQTGARGLRRAVLRTLDPVDYRLAELADEGVTRITITADVVRRGAEPVLERIAGAGPVPAVSAKQLCVNALAPPPAPHGSLGASGKRPPGISNTTGWSEQRLKDHLERVRATLDWEQTSGSARKWWKAFEDENQTRLALVIRLAEELALRKATITEFFMAYVYSNTDNIQANLHFLDYKRLKKEEEDRKKREKTPPDPGPADPPPTTG